MPRRSAPGGQVFHVLNRAIAGTQLFGAYEDYRAFERLMAEVQLIEPMRILSYCLMPNHWHMMLWPLHDNDLSTYLHRLTSIHAQRWRKHRGSEGRGHVYQGPFKSFPTHMANGVISVGRYVERNALTANLVQRAEDWRFSSLWRLLHPGVTGSVPLLAEWPIARPQNWVEFVNEPQTSKEVDAIRRSILKGTPFGPKAWQVRIAEELNLERTMRSRGRPPNK